MTAISEIIKKICEKLSRQEGYQRAWLEKHWEEIVGKPADRHSIPRIVRNQVLYVNVDSSTWNQALFIEKRRLIQRINQCFSTKIILDLKLQLGNDADFLIREEKKPIDSIGMTPVTRQSKLQTKIIAALRKKRPIQSEG